MLAENIALSLLFEFQMQNSTVEYDSMIQHFFSFLKTIETQYSNFGDSIKD